MWAGGKEGHEKLAAVSNISNEGIGLRLRRGGRKVHE